MKRVVCLLLALLMFTSIIPLASAEEKKLGDSKYYSDVNMFTHNYFFAANYLYEHDIMKGVSNNGANGKALFGGDRDLTRAEIIIMLWRLDGSPEVNGTFAFTDCSYDTTVTKAVKWAVKNNITSGTSATTFSPKQAVTHQDALLLIYRFIRYCGYVTQTDGYYEGIYGSPLKGFSGYAKGAAAWAYQNNILTQKDIEAESFGAKKNCTRGSAANYLYRAIGKYQKKYGLIVVNTNAMNYAADARDAMKTMFEHYGVKTVVKTDIESSAFSVAMTRAFNNSKRLDICYIYCASHGGENGLALFKGTGSSRYLTPNTLRNQIDLYKGTFMVFVSGCHTGTYINKGINDANEDDKFDADAFVSILSEKVKSGELAGTSRIKVLCSSKKSEVSYYTLGVATKFWCLGSGYDLESKTFVSPAADENYVGNRDGKVSLKELWSYSLSEVNQKHKDQHVVCSDPTDTYIIFENVNFVVQ